MHKNLLILAGLLLMGGALLAFINEENMKQERINAANKAAQAENTKKANELHKALTGPLPGKILDFSKEKK